MTTKLLKISDSRCYFSGFSVKKVCTYLFCFFSVALALFFANKTFATGVIETFDTYPASSTYYHLGGQGSWTGNRNYVSTTAQAYSAPNAALIGYDAVGYTDLINSVLPNYPVKFYAYATDTNDYIERVRIDGIGGITFDCEYSGHCFTTLSDWTGADFIPYIYRYTGFGTWDEITLNWDNVLDTLSYTYATSGGSWTSATHSVPHLASSTGITFENAINYSLHGLLVDDLSFNGYAPPPPLTGQWPVMTPTWPSCATRNAASTTGTMTGKIELPGSSDLIACYKLKATFDSPPYALGYYQASTTFTLTPGTDYNYSLNYDLPTDHDWLVNYLIYCDYNAPDGAIGFALWKNESCTNTIMAIGTSTLFYWPEEQAPPGFASEDCSSYALLERMVCEIKNFIGGIFVPSPEKTQELKDTLDMVKQKAPYTYLNATKDFIGDLNSEISAATTTISLSLFGATGTANFDVFQATTTFAGTTQVFKTFLRTISFALIFFLAFIPWAINFLKRIFK